PKCVNKIQHFFNLSKETSESMSRSPRRKAQRRVPRHLSSFATVPMIQHLVTPIRSSAPRHLKSLIHRRTEHHKEQKAEFEYVSIDLHCRLSYPDTLVLQ
ncbi:hypothetical protein B0H14DRAFT_2350516, partial [Mycena olivaceomarginata]